MRTKIRKQGAKALTSLNAVCPYFTMFPLDFPLQVLHKERRANSWVFDPFCGRGTTNFAARLLGFPSMGIDSSPVATAIALAKISTTSFSAVMKSARHILRDSADPVSVPKGIFWERAYREKTLIDVCRLREELLRDSRSSARRVLRAIVLGALHGPLNKEGSSYFSNQSPRTFAPKPNYAVEFWKEHRLDPPIVDVYQVIQRRAERFLAAQLPSIQGAVINTDSREWVENNLEEPFSWIITSPPYYGMRMYIPDQWLRYWFIGGSSSVEYGSRKIDFEHSSPEYFARQLGKVWKNAALMSKPRARLVCRFGGIQDRKHDCVAILKDSFSDSGWQLTTLRNAGSANSGRRQATQFGKNQRKQPLQEYDVYARRVD